MNRLANDGLAHVQSQSHIAANTWRQWCTMLSLDPTDAVDVWEQIGYPITMATRQLPDVAFILQLRAARLDLDILDFKVEVPVVLHCLHFIQSLHDDRLDRGKLKNALLKMYRKTAIDCATAGCSDDLLEYFVVDLCSILLIAKLLPVDHLSLAGVVKPFVEGRGSIDQIIRIGIKDLDETSWSSAVYKCLSARESLRGVEVTEVLEQREEGADDAVVSETAEGGQHDDEYEDEYEDPYEEAYDDEDASLADARVGGGGASEYINAFFVAFKTALQGMYEAGLVNDSAIGHAKGDNRESMLSVRRRAIAKFNPLQAVVPTLEQAKVVARRAEVARNPQVAKAVKSGGGGVSGGGGARRLTHAERNSMMVRNAATQPQRTPRADEERGTSSGVGFIETVDRENYVDVEAVDRIELEYVNLPQVGDKAKEMGQLLSAVEPHDQQVWSIFLDPVTAIDDCRTLARTLSTEGTGAHKAYSNLKQIVCYFNIKQMLSSPTGHVKADRNFMIEVRSFINGVANARSLDINSRPLEPLGNILDHAGAALVRLEALRVNHKFATAYPDRYTRESATMYYEEALRPLTDMEDRQLRGAVRQKADGDTSALLVLFHAKRFVDGLVAQSCAYMERLSIEGRTGDLEDFRAACEEAPLDFGQVEEMGVLGELPAQFAESHGMGDIFDAACLHVVVKMWEVMKPVHYPEQAVERVCKELRRIMVSALTVSAEARRHQERPSIALRVASLDKLTGNSELKDYFVRVDGAGQVAYIEDFETGDYVDLFELREYKPIRLHAAAKQQQEDSGEEALQTGRKYLFTVGRTNRLFGLHPGDLVDGCVRAEGGSPKLFPVF